MSDATIWVGPQVNVPVVNADGNIFEEVQIAILNQTVFNLVTFSYTVNTKSIFVWKNGLMLRRSVDYQETDSDTITLLSFAAAAGDKFWFVAFAIAEVDPPVTLNGLPTGGSAGMVLYKQSGSDYDTDWANVSALGYLLDQPYVNVASATNIDLEAITTTRNLHITGAVQIDGFTVASGKVFVVKFMASLILNNNAAIVCPNGAAVLVTPGDSCLIRATAVDTVEIIGYCHASNSQNVINFNDLRLSLQVLVPVPTANIIGGTIYATAFRGNKLSIFDGISWVVLAATGSLVILGGLTIGLPYDIFYVYNAGTGGIDIELTAWTNTGLRASALGTLNGVRVKNTDKTRKYAGTFVPVSAATTEDSETRRYLYNYYHRMDRNGVIRDVTASWNYTTAAYQQANASAANQFGYVMGWSEDYVDAELISSVSNTNAGVNLTGGIGLDSTTVAAASSVAGVITSPAANAIVQAKSRVTFMPAVGLHTVNWLEKSAAVGASTWYGGTSAGLDVKMKC